MFSSHVGVKVVFPGEAIAATTVAALGRAGKAGLILVVNKEVSPKVCLSMEDSRAIWASTSPTSGLKAPVYDMAGVSPVVENVFRVLFHVFFHPLR